MLASPRFKRAIRRHVDGNAVVEKDVSTFTVNDWDTLHDACADVFKENAPVICVGEIPEGHEHEFNDDPLPEIIGCDGVFAINDSAGFGLSKEWYTTPGAAVEAASLNWFSLIFKMPRKRSKAP